MENQIKATKDEGATNPSYKALILTRITQPRETNGIELSKILKITREQGGGKNLPKSTQISSKETKKSKRVDDLTL